MAAACKVFGVEGIKVTVVDDTALQDGPDTAWSLQLIAHHVGTALARTSADTIITFDDGGVSRHPNHIAVGAGVEVAVAERGGRVAPLYLETTSILRKFIGPLDGLVCLAGGSPMCVADAAGVVSTYHAMTAHASQWVWFRKLFFVFSRYTHINTFRTTRRAPT